MIKLIFAITVRRSLKLSRRSEVVLNDIKQGCLICLPKVEGAEATSEVLKEAIPLHSHAFIDLLLGNP